MKLSLSAALRFVGSLWLSGSRSCTNFVLSWAREEATFPLSPPPALRLAESPWLSGSRSCTEHSRGTFLCGPLRTSFADLYGVLPLPHGPIHPKAFAPSIHGQDAANVGHARSWLWMALPLWRTFASGSLSQRVLTRSRRRDRRALSRRFIFVHPFVLIHPSKINCSSRPK